MRTIIEIAKLVVLACVLYLQIQMLNLLKRK